MTVAPSHLRQQGDLLADQAFLIFKGSNTNIFQILMTNKDLPSLGGSVELSTELLDTFQLPSWADPQHLKQGSQFFQSYTAEILAILGLYALPYCYAGARGVRVLHLSKKIKEDPERRLLETAQFVFDVCGPDAFDLTGRGLASIFKVRMMHAAARFYSRKEITDECPVNQEDMLGTMLSFSLLVIRGLKKLGIGVTEKEMDAYFHLWKVIGYMMGIEQPNLPKDIRDAAYIERSIRKREFRSSVAGQELTAVLIQYINRHPMDIPYIKPGDLMAYLLGEDLCSILGLGHVPIKMGMLEMVTKVRNSLKDFSAQNYSRIVNDFQKNLIQADVNPHLGSS